MSATFLDYDNDGLLDIYTGNMWSDSGLRVTASPAFMPEAPPEVRALYRRHARGNSLFRNRGDGRFDDTTLAARAEMGRWAWSSDALDFDSDGWEDLYVVNGMLTRAQGRGDLEGYFWRQVVARSPLTRVKGTPYDDAWRAINQLLIHESMASRQRNVLLRNDGRGGFDEVSGAAGLDLDQDGRSFAVFDVDRDGDQDLAVMAARQAPQLRVFRNDFATGDSPSAESPRRWRFAWWAPRATATPSARACACRPRRCGRTQGRAGRLRVPVAAFEGADLRVGAEPTHRLAGRRVAVGRARRRSPTSRRISDSGSSRAVRSRASRSRRRRRRSPQPARPYARADEGPPCRSGDVDVRAVPGARFLRPRRAGADAIARRVARAARGRAAVVRRGRRLAIRARGAGERPRSVDSGGHRRARHRA